MGDPGVFRNLISFCSYQLMAASVLRLTLWTVIPNIGSLRRVRNSGSGWNRCAYDITQLTIVASDIHYSTALPPAIRARESQSTLWAIPPHRRLMGRERREHAQRGGPCSAVHLWPAVLPDALWDPM